MSSPQVLCPGPKAMTCLIWSPFHGNLRRQLAFVVQIVFALLPRLAGWQQQPRGESGASIPGLFRADQPEGWVLGRPLGVVEVFVASQATVD